MSDHFSGYYQNEYNNWIHDQLELGDKINTGSRIFDSNKTKPTWLEKNELIEKEQLELKEKQSKL